MNEQGMQIRTPDGVSDSVLYVSEDRRRLPGVIFLTDIIGIRPSQRAMAWRLAAEGYTVLMPNVFYRTGRPPLFDFPLKMGEERTMKRLRELSEPLTPEAFERDASAYVDFLAAQESVSEGPMGVVGYCFSGGLAMRTAAARPDRIAAAASFHGGNLVTDTASSPHLVLSKVKARLYFGHAVNDRSMPVEAIRKLEAALEAWGGAYQSEIYDGALHGWMIAGGRAYHEEHAQRGFSKLMELLDGTLKTPVAA